MATEQLGRVVHDVRRAALHGGVGDASDGELLGQFIAERDESAFAELVRRHGGMVLGVCRRVVGNLDDAHDAFQATFLVLARKADAIHPPDAVGNWLYGVAYRTALEARKKRARRDAREKQGIDMPDPMIHDPDPTWDLLQRLDDEIDRLPEKYRTPIVLCDLEGRSRAEAATHMNIPEGTLSSRLATARRMLADRLSRGGIVLSVAVLVTMLAQQAAQAAQAVPPSLASVTTQAAVLFAAGNAPAASLIPPHVLSLTEGVLNAMFLTKVKIVAAWVVALVFLVGAVAVGWQSVETPGAVAGPRLIADAPPSDVKSPTPPQRELPRRVEVIDKKDEPKADAKSAFTRIHIKMGKVNIRQTDKTAVEVDADPIFVKSVEKRIENGTLFLNGRNPSVAFRVEVKELSALKVEGVSQVEVVDLKTKRLEVTLDTVAKVTITGSADEQVIIVNGGAAQFDGSACKGKKADVTISNAGSAIVNVSDDLKATIPGPGRLEYLGTPKVESGLGIAAKIRARDADVEAPKQDPAKKEPTKDEPAKPGSIKITAKVDGYTQGTEFNTQKYPFKYSNSSRLDPEQLQALGKPGDVSDATAKALLGSVLWPGMGDTLAKAKLKSDGKKITGDVEVAHKYGKQGTHILKFKLEGTIEAAKLTLRAVDPAVLGTWDWGGGKIKLVGKVDIAFDVAK